jgi:hypothetical protein
MNAQRKLIFQHAPGVLALSCIALLVYEYVDQFAVVGEALFQDQFEVDRTQVLRQ